MRLVGLLLGMTLAGVVPSQARATEAEVDLELLTDSPLAAQGSHEWLRALEELGFASLRIRAARATDELKIDDYGTKERPRYRVVGRISSRQEVQLPGGKFSVRDVKGLRAWLSELKVEGPEGVLEPRSALGLTQRRLREVLVDLEQPVGFSTEDRPADEVVKKIGAGLAHPVVLAEGAEKELTLDDARTRDELQGLSAGTALAAALRPAGLVLRPRRVAGRTEYHIGPPAEGEKGWPIGWPLEKSPRETYAELFEMLNVELDDVTLAEAVEAVQARLKIPFLFDHNALVRYEVDPAKIKVSLPAQRTAYALLLQKSLAKGQLRYELRRDEAGRPFLWITTMRPL